MKKILITGASGFIGSFLVEKALEKNYNIAVAIRKNSNRKFITDTRISFVELDYSNYRSIEAFFIVNHFDYVIHNAGLTKACKPEEYFDVNYNNTKNFIDGITASKNIPQKFLLVSSLAVYGPGNQSTMLPIKQDDSKKPITNYGKSKLMAEQYLLSNKDLRYIVIRPTAVYGPREKDFLQFFSLINKGFEFYIGLKPQYISMIYVKDLVNVIFDSLESDIVNKEYNIADGNSYLNTELAGYIREALNKKTFKLKVPINIAWVIAKITENIARLSGSASTLNGDKIAELSSLNWCCDISKAKSELNFNPKYNLKAGVFETAEWYKENGWLK